MDIRKTLLVKSINYHSLSQSEQHTQVTNIQEEEIRMSINLSQVEKTSEKLRRILRSQKTRFSFYTGSTLGKVICKPKDRELQKIKTIPLMILTVIAAKQSTSMNLNGL